MPVYEYRCSACGETSSFFTRSMNSPVHPECYHCKAPEMRRLISSFTYHKSLKTLHEKYGPTPAPGASPLDYYKDPRNVGRRVEQTFQKYGAEMPQSVRDKIDAAREGELPKELDI